MRSMVLRSFFAGVLVVATACQRHTSSCGPAVSGAVDRMVSEARAKMPPPVAANIARMTPQIKQAITESCEADKWAPAAIECISKANGREQLDACDMMLTPQQRTNERRHNDELLKGAILPLDKPGVDKTRHDPHEGLGIPPADELRGATPPPSAPPTPSPAP